MVFVDAVEVNPAGVGHVVDVPVIGWPAWSASAPSIMHFMIGPATLEPVTLEA